MHIDRFVDGAAVKTVGELTFSICRETGPALVGVELKSREDYEHLIQNLEEYHINYTEFNKDDNLFGYLM